jgi:hypothetical protein
MAGDPKAGDQFKLARKVQDWDVRLNGPAVELFASLEFENREATLDLLTLSMDPSVAVRLYEKLGSWIRSGDRILAARND